MEKLFLLKPIVAYIRLFSSSPPFPKFRKQNLMYFGHKNIKTGPSSSHKLATFLK